MRSISPEVRQCTARLAAVWAAEVSSRASSMATARPDSPFAKFVLRHKGTRLLDELTTLFYVVVDESLATELVFPLAPSELESGPAFELGRSLKWLIFDLQVAAAPFATQRKAIPEPFVPLADEVARGVGDRLLWFQPGGFLHGLLMQGQLDAASRVSDWFGSISGRANAHLWSESAMQEAAEWSHARVLARHALALFGIE